jgi:hypothetical protein
MVKEVDEIVHEIRAAVCKLDDVMKTLDDAQKALVADTTLTDYDFIATHSTRLAKLFGISEDGTHERNAKVAARFGGLQGNGTFTSRYFTLMSELAARFPTAEDGTPPPAGQTVESLYMKALDEKIESAIKLLGEASHHLSEHASEYQHPGQHDLIARINAYVENK